MIGTLLGLALAAVPGRPITAEVTRTGGQVRVRVIGAADRAIAARYALTTGGGGNRAVQRGDARLRAGERATLVDIGQNATPDWAGELSVTLDDGTHYTLALVPNRD